MRVQVKVVLRTNTQARANTLLTRAQTEITATPGAVNRLAPKIVQYKGIGRRIVFVLECVDLAQAESFRQRILSLWTSDAVANTIQAGSLCWVLRNYDDEAPPEGRLNEMVTEDIK